MDLTPHQMGFRDKLERLKNTNAMIAMYKNREILRLEFLWTKSSVYACQLIARAWDDEKHFPNGYVFVSKKAGGYGYCKQSHCYNEFLRDFAGIASHKACNSDDLAKIIAKKMGVRASSITVVLI